MRSVTIGIIIVLTLVVAAPAKKKKKPVSTGAFDYYILSLSWSPQHCAETHDPSTECTGATHYGFVVHGLWPNANNGKNPENCPGPPYDPSFATPDLLKVMPSTTLVQHEWVTHGTCSGLAPKDYFTKILDARALITIPAEFQSPDHTVSIAPADLRQKFATANSSIPLTSFSVSDKGKYLEEMRVCLTKDLHPLACIDKGDTGNKPIQLRPVQ